MNFSPRNPAAIAAEASEEPARGAWQHFFLWGLVPNERTIDAREACGGASGIASIYTQHTFLQGLVRTLTSFYVNIYSPWNGAIYCTRVPRSPAPAQPDAGAPADAGAN